MVGGKLSVHFPYLTLSGPVYLTGESGHKYSEFIKSVDAAKELCGKYHGKIVCKAKKMT